MSKDVFMTVLSIVLFGISTGVASLQETERTEYNYARQTEEALYTQVMTSGLNGDERREAYLRWYRGQEAPIAIDSLIALFSTKQHSLADGFCKFVTDAQYGQDIKEYRTVEWSFSGTMVMRDEDTLRNVIGDLSERFSYNGKHLQRYNRILNSGEIVPFPGYFIFYKQEDPLTYAMLTDSNRDFQFQFWWVDLVTALKTGRYFIQGMTEQVNGSECVVLFSGTPAYSKIYLDVEKDFSVMRFVHYKQSAPPNFDPWLSERQMTRLVDMDGLTNYGNGVWLPSVVHDKRYTDGEQTTLIITTLLDAGFNIGLSSDIFNNIFPPKSLITDFINNIRYRNFDNAESIQHFLDRSLFTLPKMNTDE